MLPLTDNNAFQLCRVTGGDVETHEDPSVCVCFFFLEAVNYFRTPLRTFTFFVPIF